MSFMSGTPGSFGQRSLLTRQQRGVHGQLTNAAMARGGGGAFGTAADYYRDLLSDNSSTANQMMAPEMRRFNEQIIPDLSEQFAGMGSGGLSSSGFRNAAVGAGTDLSERLGAIRANLRQQGAAGLAGIGQQALNPVMENYYRQGQPGFGQMIAPAIGTAVGAYFGGPGGAMAGNAAGQGFNSLFGKSNPYGNMQSQGNSVVNASYGMR